MWYAIRSSAFPTGTEWEEAGAIPRVEIWTRRKRRPRILSNLLPSRDTIAAIYKDRWEVELFFKALKQTLKIKTFVGTSANAVRTQVWTALIAMLVLKYLQLKSTFSCHFDAGSLCCVSNSSSIAICGVVG